MNNQSWNETQKINRRLQGAANNIYKTVFPVCNINRNVPIELDKFHGIDLVIHLPHGERVTVQEKFRSHQWLHKLEFTQEYYNAVGTEYERYGEWFHLDADLYFYGWESITFGEFDKWAILDVPKYKEYVKLSGGLHNVGTLKQNRKFGKASFYAIPIQSLEPVFFTDYRKFRK